MFKKYSKFIILLSAFCFLLSANICYASLLDKIPCAQEKGETCTLDHFVQLFVNVAHFILSITGSLALLAFVWGGVMFLISGGSTERIAQAKKILINAVIGIIIVFASYTIISFILATTCFDTSKTSWNTTGYEWWNNAKCKPPSNE